jgi:ring-1,2-phenylacetyl-CoA epoxidase subunit PaaD
MRTTLENAFGPTQCRSIRHCPDCRQPFEAFKPI